MLYLFCFFGFTMSWISSLLLSCFLVQHCGSGVLLRSFADTQAFCAPCTPPTVRPAVCSTILLSSARGPSACPTPKRSPACWWSWVWHRLDAALREMSSSSCLTDGYDYVTICIEYFSFDCFKLVAFIETSGFSSPTHLAVRTTAKLGQVLGYFAADVVRAACDHLRVLKTTTGSGVPPTLEVALVVASERGQFPGLFLFTSPARMIRPVRNLRCNSTEFIGTFEQVNTVPHSFLFS